MELMDESKNNYFKYSFMAFVAQQCYIVIVFRNRFVNCL